MLIKSFPALLLLLSTAVHAQDKVTLFAAASLNDALSDIAKVYEKQYDIRVQTSFASSSTLAKQIERGAPADIFISADQGWMDYLKTKKRIKPNSCRNLLSNRLVVISPKNKGFNVVANKTFNFAKAFNGKLCIGETQSVPAGIYAKQSLVSLNWWDAIKTRIVGMQDVRAALVFVERGECAAGIVYETDAVISNKVKILAVLPEQSHQTIMYPISMVKGANSQAAHFYNYLSSSSAQEIFTQYGFKLF